MPYTAIPDTLPAPEQRVPHDRVVTIVPAHRFLTWIDVRTMS